MNKESQDHLMSAIGDVIKLGAKPANVAAFMIGQATYLLKEQGYIDSEVVGIVESALKNYERRTGGCVGTQ